MKRIKDLLSRIINYELSRGVLNVLLITYLCLLIFLIYLVLRTDVGGDSNNDRDNKSLVILYDSLLSNNLVADSISIMHWLGYYGIRFKGVVYAQIMLETGNLSSELFRRHNNLFGMGYSRSRGRYICYCTSNGYAGYSHWILSIRDYGVWQSRYAGDIVDSESYLRYLGKNYATDSSYVLKLRRIIRNKNLDIND